MNSEGLNVYAADLMPFEMIDIHVALEKLGKEPKGEYAPALHDIGTIIEVVGMKASTRKNSQAKFDREQERKNTEQHMKYHPEDYFSISEMVSQLKEKFGSSRTGAK